jgi:hypothetical protein
MAALDQALNLTLGIRKGIFHDQGLHRIRRNQIEHCVLITSQCFHLAVTVFQSTTYWISHVLRKQVGRWKIQTH